MFIQNVFSYSEKKTPKKCFENGSCYLDVCFYANVGTTLSQLSNANHLFGNVGPMLNFCSNHDYNVDPMLVQHCLLKWLTLIQRCSNIPFWEDNVGPMLDFRSNHHYNVGTT
jgi:hypothetical protein